MEGNKNLTKDDLLEAFDQYCESLRRLLYYKTGDMDLVEDLIQEIFIKTWEMKSAIKKDTLKSLLFKMANNLIVDHFRHKHVVLSHQRELVDQHEMEFSSPHFLIEEKEFAEKLDSVIKAIPDGCREVFLMNKIDEIKYKEIAEMLDLSVKAIEKRMSKAIGIVKAQLGVKI